MKLVKKKQHKLVYFFFLNVVNFLFGVKSILIVLIGLLLLFFNSSGEVSSVSTLTNSSPIYLGRTANLSENDDQKTSIEVASVISEYPSAKVAHDKDSKDVPAGKKVFVFDDYDGHEIVGRELCGLILKDMFFCESKSIVKSRKFYKTGYSNLSMACREADHKHYKTPLDSILLGTFRGCRIYAHEKTFQAKYLEDLKVQLESY